MISQDGTITQYILIVTYCVVTRIETNYIASLDDTGYNWDCTLGQPCMQIYIYGQIQSTAKIEFAAMFACRTDKCKPGFM